MSKLLIGTERPHEIWLGNTEIKQLYMGNELIWERIPDVYEPWVLNTGAANGLTWSAGVFANPSNVTQKMNTSSSTYMRIYITASSSATAYYGNNWSTTNTIRIPRDATKLNIRVNKTGDYYIGQYRFGLILPDAPDWTNVANGGVISSAASVPSGTTVATPSITIPEEMRGSDDYKIVIGFWGKRDTQKEIRISRVWFS